MFKFVILAALVALCAAQKEIFEKIGEGVKDVAGLNGDGLGAIGNLGALPVEVAQLGNGGILENLGAETLNIAAPAISMDIPSIHLPKGGQEVIDIPHANIVLPGNSIQNKDLLVDLPTPLVEGPKPIIRTKDVLFRLPQPIFYVPKPIVQHKPMVYRVGHTLRTYTPRVNVKDYLFSVPSAKITGKSGYSAVY